MQHTFSNIVFDTVTTSGLLFIYDPPTAWANPTDCVEFPCTAPENLLLSFLDLPEKIGSTLADLPASAPFDIVSDNPGFNGALSQCTR